MSLTSVELNYIVWRYLQESGSELAAYALEKNSHCLSYEHNIDTSKIPEGCLVNLVQKGILYTLAENDAVPGANNATLFGALVEDEIHNLDEVKNGTINSEPATEKQNSNETPSQRPLVNDSTEFSTSVVLPQLTFPPSLVTHWHPVTDVFAFGQETSSAVINAINGNSVAELVVLTHPNIVTGSSGSRNEINIVSWSPAGTLIVTGGTNGEIRAWTPDGKLKNISSTVGDSKAPPALINDLVWNDSGNYLLSIDVFNQVCLWDGNNLNLVLRVPSSSSTSGSIGGCFVAELKFAIPTSKNEIQIYSINPSSTDPISPIGLLPGHDHNISILEFSESNKLLASASDTDYIIKVWSSNSNSDNLELNNPKLGPHNFKYHKSPIVALIWLDKALLSISMEGVINLWDVTTSNASLSSNLFREENFKLQQELELNLTNVLVFSAKVSPDKKWLAIGEDSGRVSIWDIQGMVETQALKCVEVLSVDRADADMCDLSWDNASKKVSVSYKGADSVIFPVV